jgi:hypothetical protein
MVLAAALCIGTRAASAAEEQFNWTLPVYLSEGLNIRVQTKATAELMEKAGYQCIDADCKAQVAKCKANLAKCTLQPSREAVVETKDEDN